MVHIPRKSVEQRLSGGHSIATLSLYANGWIHTTGDKFLIRVIRKIFKTLFGSNPEDQGHRRILVHELRD